MELKHAVLIMFVLLIVLILICVYVRDKYSKEAETPIETPIKNYDNKKIPYSLKNLEALYSKAVDDINFKKIDEPNNKVEISEALRIDPLSFHISLSADSAGNINSSVSIEPEALYGNMRNELPWIDTGYTSYYLSNYKKWMPKLRVVYESIEYPSAVKCVLTEAFKMMNKRQEIYETGLEFQKLTGSLTVFEEFSHMVMQMIITIENVRHEFEEELDIYDAWGVPPRAYFIQGTSLEAKLKQHDELHYIMEDFLEKYMWYPVETINIQDIVLDLANTLFYHSPHNNFSETTLFKLSCNWTSKCTQHGDMTVKNYTVNSDKSFPFVISFNKGTPISDLWRCRQIKNADINPDGTSICMQCNKSGNGCSSVLSHFDIGSAVIFRYVFSEGSGAVSDPPPKFILNSEKNVLILKSALLRPTEDYNGYLLVIFKNLPTFEYILYDGRDYYDNDDWRIGNISELLCTSAEYLVYDFPRRELDCY
ncbi:hypothetical protein ENBRE01_0554 [Enteropsectra breve]|nr:hypothetical protein ENBRE01_0554 [Enteropsectra breve]